MLSDIKAQFIETCKGFGTLKHTRDFLACKVVGNISVSLHKSGFLDVESDGTSLTIYNPTAVVYDRKFETFDVAFAEGKIWMFKDGRISGSIR